MSMKTSVIKYEDLGMMIMRYRDNFTACEFLPYRCRATSHQS
jgi:hypothetical protein